MWRSWCWRRAVRRRLAWHYWVLSHWLRSFLWDDVELVERMGSRRCCTAQNAMLARGNNNMVGKGLIMVSCRNCRTCREKCQRGAKGSDRCRRSLREWILDWDIFKWEYCMDVVFSNIHVVANYSYSLLLHCSFKDETSHCISLVHFACFLWG